MKLSGLVVSVNFSDMLAISLAANARHFEEIILVTAPFDQLTHEVAARYPNVRLVTTDVFYSRGATFNKFAAVELGSELLRSDCWAFNFDADIIMPPDMLECLDREFGADGLRDYALYGPRRRQCDNRETYEELMAEGWHSTQSLPYVNETEPAGYGLFFSPRSPHLANRPWFGVDWKHGGGGDTDFLHKFPPACVHWFKSFHVLHLGPPDANWHGRVSPAWSDFGLPIAGPVSPAEAQRRHAEMRHNRGRDRQDPFRGEKL